MTKSARARIEASVPFAVTRPDRIDARRYYDPQFYELEKEKLWPHVWQMACRLQEIEKPGDFFVYEIFDQSVIVVRVDEETVKAFHNHCRHRGVKLAQDRGSAPEGFTCPFHGWQLRTDGQCKFIYTPNIFAKDQLRGADLALRECRARDLGRLCVHQLRRRCAAAARIARQVRRHGRCLARRKHEGRMVVRREAAGELEARDGSVHGGLPRAGDASAAGARRPD